MPTHCLPVEVGRHTKTSNHLLRVDREGESTQKGKQSHVMYGIQVSYHTKDKWSLCTAVILPLLAGSKKPTKVTQSTLEGGYSRQQSTHTLRQDNEMHVRRNSLADTHMHTITYILTHVEVRVVNKSTRHTHTHTFTCMHATTKQ